MVSQSQASVPSHVCIIMDGNGRWAKKRFMPRTFGHRKGVETTRLAVEFFARAGVSHLTLFAFSSENWNRPAEEVGHRRVEREADTYPLHWRSRIFFHGSAAADRANGNRNRCKSGHDA
jgi:undecaprenyl pyrophosphate synthase